MSSTTTPIPTSPAKRPGGRRRWPWIVASVFVLAAAGYVALAASLGSKTPSDTTIQGVQVGGLTHDEAVAALRSGLEAEASAPVPVVFGRSSVNLDPAEAGLAVDHVGSLDGLTGFTLNPAKVYERLTGTVEQNAVLLVDQAKMAGALTVAGRDLSKDPKDAELAYVEGKAAVTDGVDGQEVDVPASVAAVSEGWLGSDEIAGVLTVIEPDVTTAEADSVKAEVADVIVSGPLTVEVEGETFEVTANALATTVTFEPADGSLGAVYNDAKVLKKVQQAGQKAEVLTAGKDAEVTTTANGQFRVEPSVDGLDVDASKVTAAVSAATIAPERKAVIPGKVTPAAFTTDEAEKSLPTGVISTFTTHFPNSTDRTHNITLAARALNGVYVAPGEQFSLNGLLGQRTPEKGYRGAPVIYNGRLAIDYGGGISQVSTTLFNAVFFSGAQIDEFLPHSFYISRYPEGREATINWPNVDQKFTNTTKGGILITTKVDSSSITVTFQGKKTWDIEATKSARSNFRPPQTIRDDDPGCVAQSPVEGFDVTIGRIFKQGGEVVKTESFTTKYIAEDLVICTG